LGNEELHNLYSPPSDIRTIKSRRMKGARHVRCIEKIENLYKILVGQPEGKRPFRSPAHIWEGSIKMKLGEEDVDWIHLAQDGDW
jgi:hypothetical protein